VWGLKFNAKKEKGWYPEARGWSTRLSGWRIETGADVRKKRSEGIRGFLGV